MTRGNQLAVSRSEEHTSELQSHVNLVCRLLLEKKKNSSIADGSTRRKEHPSIRPYGASQIPSTSPDSWRRSRPKDRFLFFFFNDTATTEIYTLSLHDALPI